METKPNPFDRVQRRERLQLLGNWTLGVSIVGVVLFAMLYIALPSSATLQQGTILGIHASSRQDGSARFVDIELDEGGLIKVRLPDHMPYKPSATAQVSISRSKLSRATRYRVVRYED